MTEPSLQFAELVLHGGVPLDDPAEGYHESSRLYPSTAAAALPGAALIEADAAVLATTTRSSRRHPHRAGVDLPEPGRLRMRLDRALARRASRAPASQSGLALAEVSTLLHAAYGTRSTDRGTRRCVPSAGALYPLELYAWCPEVPGVPRRLLHYDPFSHRLETLGDREVGPDLAGALTDPTSSERAALVVVLTAVLWRSRFKYGARGYRFALVEAGHVAQNLLLACAALDLPALPLGGFFDRRIDAVVGANGVDEASLYVLLVGGRERP